MSIVHVVGIVQIIYQHAHLLSVMAVIYAQSAIILHFATTALVIQSARKYGERWWTYEDDEL